MDFSIMFHWCFGVHFWNFTCPGANSLIFYGNEQHEHFFKASSLSSSSETGVEQNNGRFRIFLVSYSEKQNNIYTHYIQKEIHFIFGKYSQLDLI